MAWLALKQYKNAIADFHEAFRLNPFDEVAFSNRSVARGFIRDYITAIREYDEALRLDPGNWNLFGFRGHFWHLNREYDKALKDLDESIRLDPENYELYLERGNVWRSKKEVANAIHDYDEAIRLAPRNPYCFIARGNARLAFREQSSAIRDFDEAIRLAPKSSSGILHRGIALTSDRPQDAVLQFQKFQNLSVLKRDSQAPFAAIYGYIAAKRASDEIAANQFLKAAAELLVEKSWPFPVLQYLRGEIEETDLLKKAVNDDERREAEYTLALDHETRGRKDRSNEHFRWLLEHGNPTKIEFCLAMAELHEVKGVSKPALVPMKEKRPGSQPARVVLTQAAANHFGKVMSENSNLRFLKVKDNDREIEVSFESDRHPKRDLLNMSQGIPIIVDRRNIGSIPIGLVIDFEVRQGISGMKLASPGSDQPPDTKLTLSEARRGFQTKLWPNPREKRPGAIPLPPSDIFQLVKFDAGPGRLSALLTPDPKDGQKHPAMIWITGGECNSVGDECWKEVPDHDDTSASAYRKAGIIMMFPTMRGGNDNPGVKEGFFGEVNDVLDAAAYLRKQTYVDSERIYLAGHSTGGTIALLTAEYSNQFRAVFSFGPTDDVMGYGSKGYDPFTISDPKELQLRSPKFWLHSIRNPVFVLEGEKFGNADAILTMAQISRNPNVHFYVVKQADHNSVVSLSNQLIVKRILKDTGPTCNLSFTEVSLGALNAARDGRFKTSRVNGSHN